MNVSLACAAAGHLYWLHGNAVEAKSRAIERWAARPPPTVFSRGYPPRHYVPAVPLTLVAVGRGMRAGPRRPGNDARVGVACTAASLALTAYLVRAVNIPLWRGTVAPARQRQLIERWRAVNGLRMVVLCGAVVSYAIAASRTPGDDMGAARGWNRGDPD